MGAASVQQEAGQATKKYRSSKVCTSCRQAKVKCDVAEHFPRKCSYCDTLGAPCRIDPHFKRIRKRGGGETPSIPLQDVATKQQIAPAQSNLPINTLPEDTAIGQDEAVCEALYDRFTIGRTILNFHQASSLFDIFFQKYHQFCPLFLEHRTPIPTYVSDRFLFAVIVSIASRHPTFAELALERLSEVDLIDLMEGVKEMATGLSVLPGRTLGSVQGLLLLAEWGFPSDRQKDDRSFHYINLAVQTGLQMGIHRPFHSHEYTSRLNAQHVAESVEGRERTLAWITCQQASRSISCELGLPCMYQDDWMTREAVLSIGRVPMPDWLTGIPKNVLQSLRLARFASRVAQLLGNSDLSPTGVLTNPSAQLLWQELEREMSAEEMIHGPYTDHLEVAALWTRVQLSALGLQISPTGPTRTVVMSQLYMSGIQLVEAFERAGDEIIMDWPRRILSSLKPTALILLRLIASVDGKRLDLTPVLTAASTVHRLLLNLNQFPNDKYIRAAKLVAFTSKDALRRRRESRLYGLGNGYEFQEVCSRMGAPNYYHDCLASAKSYRGRHEAEYHEAQAPTVPITDDPDTAWTIIPGVSWPMPMWPSDFGP